MLRKSPGRDGLIGCTKRRVPIDDRHLPDRQTACPIRSLAALGMTKTLGTDHPSMWFMPPGSGRLKELPRSPHPTPFA